jgi:pilus assembly protein FimV
MLKGGSVLKLFVKVLGLIAALILSNAAGAIGMGGINVTTALGEPLKAEIDLVAVGKADKNKMSARLASPESFKGAGLEYPGTLPTLNFQIAARPNGDAYVKVTTSQPVNEPFISLLVELSWSSGKLLREYTFLLDPIGFKPEQPKAVEVQPLVPGTVTPDENRPGNGKTAAPKEDSTPMRATAPVDEKISAEAAAEPVKKIVEKSNAATGPITVKQGDTLSKIARESKAPEVSLERMLVAMYRANEGAFDGKNMNRLKSGKILRVPEVTDLDKLTQVDAVKEIHAQAADWNAYRLKLASASGAASEQAHKQETSGKISTTVADKTPAAKESAKEVVRLSKGEAPGDKAAGNAKALQDKLHAMEEDATARNKSLKESNERIVILEKNIKDMQHLVELKAQPLPPAKPEVKPEVKPEIKPEPKPEVKLDASSAPVKTATVATPVPPASAVKPVKPASPKVETPPPSMLDEILAEPLYLAGGAAALLGLGGVGFMLARRRNKGGKVDAASDESGNSGTHIAAPIVPSPDTGDFTQTTTTTHIMGPAELDDVDPISEADLFLNFGRVKQAEEILKDALSKNPGNQPVRLKLLSIYASRKDTKSFASMAREVESSGDAAAWAQAAEMGRKLDPGNPMYGDADSTLAGTSGVTLDEVETPHSAPSLDFDLGLNEPAAGASAAALDVPLEATNPAPSGGLDFDLGFDSAPESKSPFEQLESTAVLNPPLSANPEPASGLDFDLGFEVPAEPVAAEEADIDKTVMLSTKSIEQINAPEKVPAAHDAPLDFDISTNHSTPAEKNPPKPEETVVQHSGSLDFDVTSDVHHPAKIEEKTVVKASAADDDIEFTLDFPDTAASSKDNHAAPAATKEPAAVDLSEINLNLDIPVANPSEAVKDAHWHDVATKLDLARAYQEMGDASGSREILGEVLKEGDAQQRAAAEVMLLQLPA